MLQKTGPGKIDISTRYSGPGMIKALLYNFDIDGDSKDLCTTARI